MRVMAIDYGDQRTGIAVSDALRSICGDAFTVAEWNAERLAERIAEEIRARGVDTLVLGLPKNMDGSEGPRAEKSRRCWRRRPDCAPCYGMSGAAAWKPTPSSTQMAKE